MLTPTSVEMEMPEGINNAERLRQVAGQAVLAAAHWKASQNGPQDCQPLSTDEVIVSFRLSPSDLMEAVLELKRQNSELHSELETQSQKTITTEEQLELESAVGVLRARVESLESQNSDLTSKNKRLQEKLDEADCTNDKSVDLGVVRRLETHDRWLMTLQNLTEAWLRHSS